MDHGSWIMNHEAWWHKSWIMNHEPWWHKSVIIKLSRARHPHSMVPFPWSDVPLKNRPFDNGILCQMDAPCRMESRFWQWDPLSNEHSPPHGLEVLTVGSSVKWTLLAAWYKGFDNGILCQMVTPRRMEWRFLHWDPRSNGNSPPHGLEVLTVANRMEWRFWHWDPLSVPTQTSANRAAASFATYHDNCGTWSHPVAASENL